MFACVAFHAQLYYARALCNLERFEEAQKGLLSLGNLDLPIYTDVVSLPVPGKEGTAVFSMSVVPFALRVLQCELNSYLGVCVCVVGLRHCWHRVGVCFNVFEQVPRNAQLMSL